MPGSVPEKISPEAEAIVTALSVTKLRSVAEVMIVPAGRVVPLALLLNIVTVPFALSPVSFFPVAEVVSLPSSLTVRNSALIIFLEALVSEFLEKVTFSSFEDCFASTERVTVAERRNK